MRGWRRWSQLGRRSLLGFVGWSGWSKVAALATAATAIAALWFTGQSLQSTEQQYALSEQAQVTERFTKAVEQLGSDKPDVRLGSIYSLERLGRDSPQDQPVILEILTSFVRTHGVTCGQPPDKVSFPVDTQAALTVIGRRNTDHDGPRLFNFNNACLAGANLYGGNFSTMAFFDADLTGANLNNARLVNASMSPVRLGKAVINYADLVRVSLQNADLTGVSMRESDLTGAYLHHSNFTGADLFYVRFVNAKLIDVNLTGADLTYANLTGADLTGANLTGICYDNRTIWPEGFTPPQPPSCPPA
ncbi:pentapeptide repeat-containing protein [Nocardia sp. NPDC055029]